MNKTDRALNKSFTIAFGLLAATFVYLTVVKMAKPYNQYTRKELVISLESDFLALYDEYVHNSDYDVSADLVKIGKKYHLDNKEYWKQKTDLVETMVTIMNSWEWKFKDRRNLVKVFDPKK